MLIFNIKSSAMIFYHCVFVNFQCSQYLDTSDGGGMSISNDLALLAWL